MADTPQPPLSLADVLETAKSVWAAFVVPSIAGLWAAWQWWRTSKLQRGDREAAEREEARRNMSSREIGYMDKIERLATTHEEDAKRERELRVAAEAQADRLDRENFASLELARAWKVRAGELLHELSNARTAADMLAATRGLPTHEWFDEALPSLEDVAADNVARRRRRDAWKAANAPPQAPRKDTA